MKRPALIRSILLSVLTIAAGIQVGCGETPTSSVKVTNGTTIGEAEYPSVARIYFTVGQGAATCSGTFISDSLLLTAAHCVSQAEVDDRGLVDMDITLLTQDAVGAFESRAESIAVYRNPEWDTVPGVNKFDLGLIKFPEDTALAVSKIASSAGKINDNVMVVGYGNNDNVARTGAGVKRKGANKIHDVREGFLFLRGSALPDDASGTRSTSGMGDSGGPLFRDGKLVGVTSGGKVLEDGTSEALYVDLASPSSKEFLAPHLAGIQQ